MRDRRRFPVALLFRIAISALLLALLLRQTSISEVFGSLRHALDRWPLALAALILPGIGVLVAANRWQTLLSGVGASLPLRDLLKAFLVGNFFNQFFPSTIAGDVARGWRIRRGLGSTTLSLTVVTSDRLIGLVGISAVALVVLVLRRDFLISAPTVWWALMAGLVAMVTGALLASHRRLSALLTAAIESPRLGRFGEQASQAYRGLRQLWNTPSVLMRALALAMLLQIVIMCHFAYLAFVLRVDVGYWDLASLIPVVSIATLLPISINGIGVREVTLASLGSLVGLSTEDAVTLSWAFLLISTLYAALGGIFYALGEDESAQGGSKADGELPR